MIVLWVDMLAVVCDVDYAMASALKAWMEVYDDNNVVFPVR